MWLPQRPIDGVARKWNSTSGCLGQRRPLTRQCDRAEGGYRGSRGRASRRFLATHRCCSSALGSSLSSFHSLRSSSPSASLDDFGPSLVRGCARLVRPARATDFLSRFVARTSLLIPSAYLALQSCTGSCAGRRGHRVRRALRTSRCRRGTGHVRCGVCASVASRNQSRVGAALRRCVMAGLTTGPRACHTGRGGGADSEAQDDIRHCMARRSGRRWTAQPGPQRNVQRTRPEIPRIAASSSWSFPSGHAMGTFIFCGLACYLVLRERRSWVAVAIVPRSSALSWCVVMAFSRLYLGVHFVSDMVLAGLVAGTAWVAVCVSALEVIRQSRTTAADI